jgi:hypothetical protein
MLSRRDTSYQVRHVVTFCARDNPVCVKRTVYSEQTIKVRKAAHDDAISAAVVHG